MVTFHAVQVMIFLDKIQYTYRYVVIGDRYRGVIVCRCSGIHRLGLDRVPGNCEGVCVCVVCVVCTSVCETKRLFTDLQ